MRRILLIAAAFPVYVVALAAFGTAMLVLIVEPPSSPGDFVSDLGDALSDSGFVLVGVPFALVMAITQGLFLLPVIRRRPPTGTRSRPLWLSLGVASMVGAILTCAAAIGVIEAVRLLVHPPASGPSELLDQPGAGALLLGIAATSWLLWSIVLFVFTRDVWGDRMVGRLARWLITGTIIELVLIVPVDVMMRRRTSCHCTNGTFLALGLALFGILWLAGPGIYLVATAKRRRRWRAAWCGRCGQARGPSPGERCPECGYEWG